MGIGVSMLLIAVGAVLTFAVNATVSGVDINTIGWILMIVGACGLMISLIFFDSFFGSGRRGRSYYEKDLP
jgi:Flp pilus assembly protein protease CpaA